jgi:hypothetical protein
MYIYEDLHTKRNVSPKKWERRDSVGTGGEPYEEMPNIILYVATI